VGLGRHLGKGWLQRHSGSPRIHPGTPPDFIFAVYTEEFGLIGNGVLLVLYALLVARA